MGRMKNLFMEMQEQNSLNIEQEYGFDSGILCPNCMKNNLLEYSAEDLYCKSCAYDFIRINKTTVRFK